MINAYVAGLFRGLVQRARTYWRLLVRVMENHPGVCALMTQDGKKLQPRCGQGGAVRPAIPESRHCEPALPAARHSRVPIRVTGVGALRCYFDSSPGPAGN